MIKTAQKKFIFITLAIVFAVMSILFAILFNIYSSDLRREVDMTLEEAKMDYYRVAPKTPIRNTAIIEIVTIDGLGYKIIQNDAELSQSDLDDIVTYSRSRNISKGNLGDNYFILEENGSEVLFFIADMSMRKSLFNAEITKTLILFGSVFLFVAVLVAVLSAKVFYPIKTVLAKQRQFISDASHELKTPVSIISANADAIKAQGDNAFADSIKNQVDRLDFLVSDLLTLARLDEGSAKTLSEKFDLSEEVLGTALPFDAVAFEKGKTLVCDVDENIEYYGDKQGVKQILNILLDNAVKYSSDGGTIKVSLKKANAVRLTVYNDGSAVREDQTKNIFERFYRGDDSRSRETGGNGLGLSIAKSIAVANKWTITANSVYGKSMTIEVIL